MSNDRALGGLILIGSLIGIVAYFWLVFMSAWQIITIQVSAFLAVAGVLLIVAWIGYTLATTPPPVPLEDLDIDLDEELDFEDENKDEDVEKGVSDS